MDFYDTKRMTDNIVRRLEWIEAHEAGLLQETAREL